MYRRERRRAAWQKVAATAGAAGVDGQSVEQFAAREQPSLQALADSRKAGSYTPLAVWWGEIAKGARKLREGYRRAKTASSKRRARLR